jgi:putative polyketide hydroxylase
MNLTEVPVLVVGAGPAGLTTAITLARYGVETLLVERRSEQSTLPRATAVSTRSMEIIRSFGLEQQVRAGEVEVEWDGWIAETLASKSGITMPVGYPSREQAARVSPTAPASVPQDHLEPVLLSHLRTFPAAHIRFGTELLALEQDAKAVTATLRDRESQAIHAVRARYVVAADGAHSTVRATLGIPMEGPDDLVTHSTVLFHAPLWEAVGPRCYGLYIITHPQAAGIFVPLGAGDRWLYGQELTDGQDLLENATDAELTDLLRTASGVPDLEPWIERVSHFSFAAQIASTYREGRVFLAGDAAHRVTPRGGTGMNTAIHDGYDLGWKLAWISRGWAARRLLDTYESERRPVGLHNTARSADPNGSHLDADAGLAADLGGRIPHAWLCQDSDLVSTLDLVGPGLTLLTDGYGGSWRSAIPSSHAPIQVHGLDEATAQVLGIGDGGAVLVRPDGKPVVSWPTSVADPGAALAASLDRLAQGEVTGPASPHTAVLVAS